MFHLTRNQRDHTCRKRTCLLPFVTVMSCCIVKAEAAGIKDEVSDCSEWLHTERVAFRRDQWDRRNSGILEKAGKTARPPVALYLNELLIQKRKFRIQISRHWPQLGLPQLALWHHVGVTIGITLDKNGSLK